MIKIVGITGPSGAGKSLLCKYIADAGIPCIDSDEIYHAMLVPPSRCIDAIAEVFGNGVIAKDGSLDRSALSACVFSSPEKLDMLNKTVLPLVIEEIKQIIDSFEQNSNTVVAVDAPTLIESGFYRECDIVITVTAPIEARIARIEERDDISVNRARQRVAAQRDDSFYTAVSHITLVNDADEKMFAEKAKEIIKKIKSL